MTLWNHPYSNTTKLDEVNTALDASIAGWTRYSQAPIDGVGVENSAGSVAHGGARQTYQHTHSLTPKERRFLKRLPRCGDIFAETYGPLTPSPNAKRIFAMDVWISINQSHHGWMGINQPITRSMDGYQTTNHTVDALTILNHITRWMDGYQSTNHTVAVWIAINQSHDGRTAVNQSHNGTLEDKPITSWVYGYQAIT